jgi:hypothetical protein
MGVSISTLLTLIISYLSKAMEKILCAVFLPGILTSINGERQKHIIIMQIDTKNNAVKILCFLKKVKKVKFFKKSPFLLLHQP